MKSSHTVQLPCGGFNENPHRQYMMELITADPATFSEREEKLINNASEYGELYPAIITYNDDGSYTIKTDLGHGENHVSVTMPKCIDVCDSLVQFSKFLENFV